jgi:hypothetical protein
VCADGVEAVVLGGALFAVHCAQQVEARAVMAATAPRQPAVRAEHARHLVLIRPDRRRFV